MGLISLGGAEGDFRGKNSHSFRSSVQLAAKLITWKWHKIITFFFVQGGKQKINTLFLFRKTLVSL